MGRRLDQEGIFMAQAHAWNVRFSDKTDSVAIEIEFSPILAEHVDGEWQPWQDDGDTYVYGRFYVIGKSGGVNTTAVAQLARSLGWDGELTSVFGDPPRTPVQITVKGEEYKDQIIFKVQWMNPKDFVPVAGGASPDAVDKLQAKYGGLLKTAAERALQGRQPTAAAKADAETSSEKDPEDDLPF